MPRILIAGVSNTEVPTLLHLAAKFGLTDLAHQLSDLPYSGKANEVVNNRGQRPYQLARKNNFPQLSNLFQTLASRVRVGSLLSLSVDFSVKT